MLSEAKILNRDYLSDFKRNLFIARVPVAKEMREPSKVRTCTIVNASFIGSTGILFRVASSSSARNLGQQPRNGRANTGNEVQLN